MGVVDNIRKTFKLTTGTASTLFTIFTNPFVWIIIIVIFLPLDVINYIILFIVNGFIMFANVIIYIGMLLVYAIVNLIIAGLNVLIAMINSISFTIPLPEPFDDIDIEFPDLGTIGFLDFPDFGVIPYYDVEDVRIFSGGTILLIWILEQFGLSFPIG
jgi:hypothetical protein